MPGNIGQYQILEKIGAGGMATVYKGFQPSLDRHVAIKVLSHQLSGKDSMVRRFKRESMIVARLAHPNIIHIIDRGTTKQGLQFFVMDFVEGTDLEKEIRKGSYNLTQKMEIMVQVCKALAYAHKNGVIHRDIKPANVLIDSHGHAMVADFGIAQLVDEHMTGGALTREGMILGTLSYMSPEQTASAKGLTEASDIYSLGVVMYELFTGVRPAGYFKQPRELAPEIPSQLEEIIMRCLGPEPEERVQSAEEIIEVLLERLQGAHLGDATKAKAVEGVAKGEDSLVLLDIINEHKFGAVYLFRRRVSGKLMVVKKYSAPVGGLEEAKKILALNHPNIVKVAGASGNESIYIVAMEYISGGNLEDRMVRPHGWREALNITRQICKGLTFAYSHGVLHGNLRPSNIMITQSGQVKLTDFGLKEHYAKSASGANWYNPFRDPKSHLTDIFSAGSILYKMLTGSVPIWRKGELDVHPAMATVPEEVRKLVYKMISRNVEENFSNASEVISSIDEAIVQAERTIALEDYRAKREETGATLATPAPSGLGHKRKRLLLLRILLLAVFVETVIFYLISTGQAKGILAFWLELLRIPPF